MRPKRRGESLQKYAKHARDELIRRAGKAYNTRGIRAVWPEIFQALSDEGTYVREVSPAAVVIYQQYFSIAATYLREHPDKGKFDELVACVKKDLGSNLAKFSKMKKFEHFTEEERREGAKAFGIIRKTLVSMA